MVVCLPTRRTVNSRMLPCLFAGDVLQYLKVVRAHLAQLISGVSSRDYPHEAEGNGITTPLFLFLFLLVDVSFILGRRGREISAHGVIHFYQIQFRRLMKKCAEVCRSWHSLFICQLYLVEQANESLETSVLEPTILILRFLKKFVFFHSYSRTSSGKYLFTPKGTTVAYKDDQEQDTVNTLHCHLKAGPLEESFKAGPR